MFEQELVEKEIKTEPLHQGDLFYGYELKNWTFDHRIYSILMISAVLNLAVAGFVLKSDFLTRRGCDTPFIGRVCQVLDTVYLGTVLYGTDREYVDQAYEKTDLGDAEVVWVDMTGETPPLSYPEGYFQLANPEEYAILQQQANNPGGLPSAPASTYVPPPMPRGGGMINTPARTPKANAGGLKGSEPKSPFSIDDSDAAVVSTAEGDDKKGGKRKGGKTPSDQTSADANTKPTPSVDTIEPAPGVTINREPMRVFGRSVIAKIDSKKVDLKNNFKVTATAVLDKDGRFDTSIDKKTKQQKSRVLTGEGDDEMVKTVQEAIAAIGDSGWLGYLKTQGIDNINFEFVQDNDELYAVITSDQPTPERAMRISSQLNGLISTATLADRMGVKALGDDEKALLQAAKASNDGKQVVLNFKLTKVVAQEMIQRNLQRVREAQAGQKTSGQSSDVSANSTAAR